MQILFCALMLNRNRGFAVCIEVTDRVSPRLWAHRAAVQSGRLVWANRGVTAVCVLPTHIMLNKIHYIRLKWTLI